MTVHWSRSIIVDLERISLHNLLAGKGNFLDGDEQSMVHD